MSESTSEDGPITHIETPVRLRYTVYPGRDRRRYLGGLAEGKIIGGRCPETGKVYVPPRAAVPVTGKPTTDIVEVEDRGVLTTFCVVRIPFEGQKLEPPYVFGAIVLDGADLPIYHLISGIPTEEIRMGLRVKARWKPPEQWGPTLESIEFFEPSGEPDASFDSFKEHL